MQLAGVAALTIAPTLLHALSETEEPEAKVADRSLFNDSTKVEEQEMERRSFMNDEAKFREDYGKRESGKAQVKTKQVMSIRFRVS